MKKIEEKKSKGTYRDGEFKENWKQLELKKDSCLRQLLTKNQYDTWKEEEKKYNYKHEGKKDCSPAICFIKSTIYA